MSASETGWMPASLAKLDFWEEFCFHPDKPVPIVANYVIIVGPADVAALAKAIAQTVAGAEALALRLEELPDGTVRQQVSPEFKAHLVDMDPRQEADLAAAATALMHADFSATLDLRRDPISTQ